MRWLPWLVLLSAALVMLPRPAVIHRFFKKSVLGHEGVDSCHLQTPRLNSTEVEAPTPVDPSQKAFDVVVYGATGFTGRLVAEYLAKHPDVQQKKVRLALAGRSADKLEALLQEVKPALDVKEAGSNPEDLEIGIFVAEAHDEAALLTMVQATQVVLTLVGPYSEHGATLVRLCAENGVHYADVSGEPLWHHRVADELHETARRTGARIVLAAGYDSAPFDLGMLMALQAASDFPGKVRDIMSMVRKAYGAVSGGTLASAAASLPKSWDDAMKLLDPYLLNADIETEEACRLDRFDVSGWGPIVRYEPVVNTVGIMHFMAPVNARIVRRSLSILGVSPTYAEGMTLQAIVEGFRFWFNEYMRGGMDLFPSRGSGPSKALMKFGGGGIQTVAELDDGNVVGVTLKWKGDIGYLATSKMIAEAGLCLAQSSCRDSPLLKYDHEVEMFKQSRGGVLTPATAMGLPLLERYLRADDSDFMGMVVVALDAYGNSYKFQ